MAILFMLGWWYGRGWVWAVSRIGHEVEKVGRIFAVDILMKTWFSPWKQITTATTFQNFFQSMADNAISRTIGFIIRTFMLITAALWASVIVISGILLVLLWPLLPLSIVILPVLYFSGVSF